MFVVLDHADARLLLHGDRRDFLFERAVLNRVAGAGQRFNRIVVLILARELIGLGAGLAEIAHRAACLVSVFEAIHQHVIDDAVMTDAITTACLLKQIGGVGHALHAAGDDDIGGARVDDVMGQHGGLHAGAAHFVDGGCAGRIRQLRAARGLAGGCLSLPGGKDAAHDHFVDPFRRQLRAVERRADRVRAKIVRAERGQFALEAAEGSADCGYDDDWIG